MVQNIFSRIEQKYLLDRDEYNTIQGLVKNYFDKDIYHKSKIYNIYFDNDNDEIIVNSIEKPKFKKKIRLRSYGIVKDSDSVYLEIKIKYANMVYKRRVPMTLLEYNDYIEKHILPKRNRQIMKEIDYNINYYKLYPKILVAYDRLSYYAKDDMNFRITFDYNLRSRYKNLKLDDDKEYDKLYFDDDKYIMEVKSLKELPIWFIKYLSSNKIYPTSFSKVGNIYIKERGEKIC